MLSNINEKKLSKFSQKEYPEYTLLITGITKNNEKYISAVLNNVEKYSSLFKDYYALFIDGYSQDSTFEIIKNWCKKDSEKRKVYYQLHKDIPRPYSLQEARNMYMCLLEEKFGKNVFLLILDCDDVNSNEINLECFKTNFEHKNWDAMFSNNTKAYYDIWALRKEDCDYDCWEMVNKTGDQSYVDKHFQNIPSTTPLIECYSAFGGTGLYNTEKLRGLRYSSFEQKDSNMKQVCEHVPFNTNLKDRGGKMFINPKYLIF